MEYDDQNFLKNLMEIDYTEEAYPLKESEELFCLSNQQNSHFEMNFDLDFNYNECDNNKVINSDEIISNINKAEDLYFQNYIEKSLKSASYNYEIDSGGSNLSKCFKLNLKQCEHTLFGLIISIMFNENKHLSENELIFFITPKFKDLRKTNGSKYYGDFKRIIKSALTSSGIFYKNYEGNWFYDEKEALNYVTRITEKVITSNLQKEKTINKKLKKKAKPSPTSNINYQLVKVYDILNNLLSHYREEEEEASSKLEYPFTDINNGLDLLKKIGDESKSLGILICFNFFKTIVSKFVKKSRKRKYEASEIQKIYDKLDIINQKIISIEDKFASKSQLDEEESN